MNILHVVDELGAQSGGPARVVYALAREQTWLGHSVTIFSSDYKLNGYKPPENVKLDLMPTVARFQRLVFAPAFAMQDYRQFDIIHLHNYRTLPNLMAANRGVPLVLQAHGNAHPAEDLKHKLANPLWRHTLRPQCSAFIADAEEEVQHYLKEGAKARQIRVVPLGIDLNEFRFQPVAPTNKTLLYLGRIHELKGLDILLHAFAHLNRPNTRLMVAGWNDGFEGACRELAISLGISGSVSWLGPLEGEARARAYAQASVYVLPSRYEMFGLTVLEACAVGAPVLVTDRCAIAKLVPRECGSVTPLEERAMAEELGRILDFNYDSFYRAFRRQWAEGYSWPKIAERIVEIYREVLTDRCLPQK